MSRRRAALTIVCATALLVLFSSAPAPWPAPPTPGDGGDAAAFRVVVNRLEAGEPYYEVFGEELRRGGYPAGSVFNWRPPLLLWALARVSEAVSRGVLITLGMILLAATLVASSPDPVRMATGGIMQAGAVATIAVPSAVLFSESWAGVLIALSVCLHQWRRSRAAIAVGLLALFARELSAPYCVACTIAAVMRGRWREVAWWLGGASVYVAYYWRHLVQVSAHRLATDVTHRAAWLGPPQLDALMIKADWHAWLLSTPPWAGALALTLVGLGIAARRAPAHVKLASAVYGGFFMVAGQPFNGYWGLVAWPTWAIASGHGASLLFEAVGSLWKRQPTDGSKPVRPSRAGGPL